MAREISQADIRERKRLYKKARWRRMRLRQLKKEPFCQCSACRDKKTVANVVDHIVPHRGSKKLFFDVTNLQSMSKRCHDSLKQSQERGGRGFNRGCDERGIPLDETEGE